VQEIKEKQVKERRQSSLVFVIILVAAIVLAAVVFNALAGGKFLTPTNITVVLSHIIYPAFVAWGLCFLFACGYTDLSIGAVVVLGAFASTVLGNFIGYPGVVLGGVVIGLALVFINFNVFAFTGIPSWIAGISLAMIYEAVAFALKMGNATKPYINVPLNSSYRVLGQLPWSIILLAAGLVVSYFIYNRTSAGLNIRAIGGNKEVSKSLGINVTVTLLLVGVISGLFIGVASFVTLSINGQMFVTTGLTSINVVFQPIAIFLLAQTMQNKINIVIAVPICSLIIYAIFNLLTIMGVPSGTLQNAFLGAFLIAFGMIAQRKVKGVVK